MIVRLLCDLRFQITHEQAFKPVRFTGPLYDGASSGICHLFEGCASFVSKAIRWEKGSLRSGSVVRMNLQGGQKSIVKTIAFISVSSVHNPEPLYYVIAQFFRQAAHELSITDDYGFLL